VTLAFGGLRFPLAPGVGVKSLLATCDPFRRVFLDYWQTVINAYCGDAYEAAMAGQAEGATGQKACAQTTTLDPLLWLKNETFRFPILGCYPVQGTKALKKTVRWELVETEYVVCYALPPLSAEQAERVEPILNAVHALLVLATERQGDESYDGGTNPLATAGIMACQFGQTRFGLIKDEGSPKGFPCFEAHIAVQIRESVVPEDGTPLESMAPTLDIGADEYGGLPTDILLDAAVQAVVNVSPVTVAANAGTTTAAVTLS
jgi:hypothetical protein